MLTIGLCALAAVVIVVAWPSALGGRVSWVVVDGTSMQPNLSTGDLVIAWDGPVGVGDVVLYQVPVVPPGGNIVHRIVGGDEASGWVVQGDNKPEADPWVVPPRNVLGRQVFAIPGVGAILTKVQGSTVSALLIGFLTVLTVIMWPSGSRRPSPERSSVRDQALRKVWGRPTERLAAMAELQDGWDGPDSVAPDPECLAAARHLAGMLPQDECLVAPWAGGVVLVRLWAGDHTRGGEGRVVELRADGGMVLYPDRLFEPGTGPEHRALADVNAAGEWLTGQVRAP